MRRECVRALLWAGADALDFNAAEALPLDVAAPHGPVWALLEAELQWRAALRVGASPPLPRTAALFGACLVSRLGCMAAARGSKYVRLCEGQVWSRPLQLWCSGTMNFDAKYCLNACSHKMCSRSSSRRGDVRLSSYDRKLM